MHCRHLRDAHFALMNSDAVVIPLPQSLLTHPPTHLCRRPLTTRIMNAATSPGQPIVPHTQAPSAPPSPVTASHRGAAPNQAHHDILTVPFEPASLAQLGPSFAARILAQQQHQPPPPLPPPPLPLPPQQPDVHGLQFAGMQLIPVSAVAAGLAPDRSKAMPTGSG
jgi:hypothetical protein